MTQDDGGYDLQPLPEGAAPRPAPELPPASETPGGAAGESTGEAENRVPIRPGEPGWRIPVPIIEKADVTPEEIAEAADAADAQQHKAAAALGYIFFLIPLIAGPNSRFARYHANQGLLVFIALFVVAIVVAILEGAGWAAHRALQSVEILALFFAAVFWLLQVAALVGWVVLVSLGIRNALSGVKDPLPVIGHWTLIHEQDLPAGGGTDSGSSSEKGKLS